MAQGARAEIDARDLLHVGVVAEGAAKAGEFVEQASIEKAQIGEHGVEADGRVPLAQDEAVPVRPLGAGGIDAELCVIEGSEHLGRRECARVVPRAGDAGEPHRLEAHEPRPVGEEIERDVAAVGAWCLGHALLLL